jgi:hypothetical protein
MKVCNKSAHHPASNIFRIFSAKNLIIYFNEFNHRKCPQKIITQSGHYDRWLLQENICFESHSEQGLDTREIIMTILNTAKCRGHDPAIFLEKIIDILAKNKNAEISKILSIQPELANGLCWIFA